MDDNVPEEVKDKFIKDVPPDLEGFLAAETRPNETFEQQFAKFSAAATLADCSKEFVYFTHGLLFTHGFWKEDPIVEHIMATRGECAPFGITLPTPVFKWFEAKDAKTGAILDAAWNSQLCVVRRDQWLGLYSYLCAIVGRNNDTKTLITMVPQLVPIVDVLALSKMTVLPERIPSVECYCFALSGNKRLSYFAPDLRSKPWDPVPIMHRNPEPKVIKYAKAIFAELAKPRAGTLEPTEEEVKKAIEESPSKLKEIMSSVNYPKKVNITDEELCNKFKRGEEIRVVGDP